MRRTYPLPELRSPLFTKRTVPATTDRLLQSHQSTSASHPSQQVRPSSRIVVTSSGAEVSDLAESGRRTSPTAWETYLEIENGNQQASDNAAVYVDLNV